MTFDFHAHILPGNDHGSPNVESSLAQLKYAKLANIDTIVATPHFYLERGHTVQGFLARRAVACEQLAMVNDTGIRVIPAAEVALSYDLTTMPGIEQLSVGNTHCILIELPLGAWGNWVLNALYHIQSNCHLMPIIAHIDRYKRKQIESLLEMDFVFQINAECLCNISQRNFFKKKVKQGKIQLLGSDVHTEPQKSYENFTRAISILGKHADSIMMHAETILYDKW